MALIFIGNAELVVKFPLGSEKWDAFFFNNLENTIHGFAVLVPVLILPISRRLLLRNGKVLSKCLFWSKRTQCADSNDNSKLTSQVVLYSFILVLYLGAIVISNQIKYYLTTNRGNFLEIKYVFYRYALQIYYGLLLKEHLPRTQERLKRDCLEH